MKGRNVRKRSQAFQKRATTGAKHLSLSTLWAGQRPEHDVGSACVITALLLPETHNVRSTACRETCTN